MSHSDPTTLALAALGEPLPAADREHIATCPGCRAELDRLQAVVHVGRAVRHEDEPTSPPPALWQRIRDELADDALGEPVGEPIGEPTGESSGEPADGLDPVPDDDTPGRTKGATAPKGRRFRLRTSLALAASAALIGATAGIGGTLWATRDESPPTRVAAETRLEPLPAHDAAGAAFVDTGGDTGRRLVVSVSGLSPQPGFYEVWLLDPGADKMIAIGLLPVDGQAAFSLPPNLEVADYPVVDVSLQQYNGSPEHSGNSVVRGTLQG